jgi:glutathione peroxidase-family protein
MLNFPHLVEMQSKFKDRGFVAVAVSIDDPANPEQRTKVDAFLTKKNTNCPSYIVKEPREEVLKKLDVEGPPCLYLFDRDNRTVKKYAGEEDFKMITADVEKLLKP